MRIFSFYLYSKLKSCSSFTVICTMSAGEVSVFVVEHTGSSGAQSNGTSDLFSELSVLKSASKL